MAKAKGWPSLLAMLEPVKQDLLRSTYNSTTTRNPVNTSPVMHCGGETPCHFILLNPAKPLAGTSLVPVQQELVLAAVTVLLGF